MPRCSPRPAATSRAAASGSATSAGGLPPAGEDLVQLVVVEADVGADAAAVEARPPRLHPRPELDLGRHRQPLDPRRQAAGLAGERVRQHRLDRAGDVGAVAAPPRLLVEQRARLDVGGDVGDVDPDPGAVALALGGDGVVEVARGGGVDGEGRKRGEVAPRPAFALRPLRRFPRFPLDRRPEAAEAELLPQQLLDRLPRRLAAARSRARFRATRRGSGSRCAPARSRRGISRRPGRRGRRGRAAWPRRPWSSGRPSPSTSGWMPWLFARLTPFGVKNSPTESFRAPPLARSCSSWKRPLP